MLINDYQRRASASDLNPGKDGLIISLMGLAGETGELLTEYKKFLRDGPSHKLFKERLIEELGDILWYVSSVSAKFDIPLSQVADNNLKKVRDRWGERELDKADTGISSFDTAFPSQERLPNSFVAQIEEVNSGKVGTVRILVDGKQMGNYLSDNFYGDDGYRFHDVFHLAYAAHLGWSPVTRKLLDRKRKSDPQVDEVEDGGRAAAIEEGISALVFAYAKDHNFFDGVTEVDYHLLKTIKGLTLHLEVNARTMGQWEKAILKGFSIWRQLIIKREGKLLVDIGKSEIILL